MIIMLKLVSSITMLSTDHLCHVSFNSKLDHKDITLLRNEASKEIDEINHLTNRANFSKYFLLSFTSPLFTLFHSNIAQ